MGFVDGHRTSGALQLSCNSVTPVLTFFSDSDELNLGQRAPTPVRGFSRAAFKGESCSQGRVGKVAPFNLCWLSTPMPGCLTALGMPRNTGGQVSSAYLPDSKRDLRYPVEALRQSSEMAAPKHTP
ncbi:uncharacterized protein LOC141725738 isoform X2 [Zonotrichia albicollis]|uniref:uncharacterized protein LOC141725738 isoform X2 n=1 Tax=Zonotrichia albicollis TaxID=44394 RepID=UPI003D80FEA5